MIFDDLENAAQLGMLSPCWEDNTCNSGWGIGGGWISGGSPGGYFNFPPPFTGYQGGGNPIVGDGGHQTVNGNPTLPTSMPNQQPLALTIQPPQSQLIAGIDNTTLLIAGGVVGLILLMR